MSAYNPGDYVKVEFPDKATGIGEWMWMRVTGCDDERQLVFGTLDSEPLNDYGGKVALGSVLASASDKFGTTRRPPNSQSSESLILERQTAPPIRVAGEIGHVTTTTLMTEVLGHGHCKAQARLFACRFSTVFENSDFLLDQPGKPYQDDSSEYRDQDGPNHSARAKAE